MPSGRDDVAAAEAGIDAEGRDAAGALGGAFCPELVFEESPAQSAAVRSERRNFESRWPRTLRWLPF